MKNILKSGGRLKTAMDLFFWGGNWEKKIPLYNSISWMDLKLTMRERLPIFDENQENLQIHIIPQSV